MSFITKDKARQMLALSPNEWRSVTMKIKWAVDQGLTHRVSAATVREYLTDVPSPEQWQEFYAKLSELRKKMHAEEVAKRKEASKQRKRDYQRRYMQQYREKKRETKLHP